MRASRWVTIPIIGFSLAIASSTNFTDFLRPTSMGIIEFGNKTELRSGRIGKNSGISIGPSGMDFFGDIAQIVVRTEPGCDKYSQRKKEPSPGPPRSAPLPPPPGGGGGGVGR